MVKGSAAAALPFSTIDGDYVVGGLKLLWMLSNSFACLQGDQIGRNFAIWATFKVLGDFLGEKWFVLGT
jgi:hypothetical protein